MAYLILLVTLVLAVQGSIHLAVSKKRDILQTCSPKELCRNSTTCCVSSTLYPKTCDVQCFGPANAHPDNGTVCVPSPTFYVPAWGRYTSVSCCANEKLVGCPYFVNNPNNDGIYSPCCLPTQACCGNGCCDSGQECCGGRCVPQGRCCGGIYECSGSSTCCGGKCCENTATSCCSLNGTTCITGNTCLCDTRNPLDIICDSNIIDDRLTCCDKRKGCCGSKCCSGSTICCSNHQNIGEKLCVTPSTCCNGVTCPNSSFCCGGFCCENSGCCFNNKCYNGPECNCDTGIPTDEICSTTTVNSTKEGQIVQCCDPNTGCCGSECCLSSQVCCLTNNGTINSKQCVDPSACCAGNICASNSSCCGGNCCLKSKACCGSTCCDGDNSCCVDGKCASGFVCAKTASEIFAMLNPPIYAIIVAFLVFLCLLILCIIVLCKSRKWCLENRIKKKQADDIDDRKVVMEKNKKLEKKVAELKHVKEELRAKQVEVVGLQEVLQEKDDEIAELEELKNENEDLKEQVEDLQSKIDAEDKEQEEHNIVGGKEPIHIIICGGGMLQETTILARPHEKMDYIIKNFCTEKNCPISKYVFYTRSGIHGKKIHVNYDLSAHDNGYVNGTRILMELAENNSLWNRDRKEKTNE